VRLLLAGLLALNLLPALFRRGRRWPGSHGRELAAYRDELLRVTRRIDALLQEVEEAIDALRRRAFDIDEAVALFATNEEQLEVPASELREMLAPEELHPPHEEYEANLERALRGIVTAERGCTLTRLPHRPPDDEEPFTYWKRAQQNIQHARQRMDELVDALVSWQPGTRPEASVAARLHRAEAEE
jgi:hypothetical protein